MNKEVSSYMSAKHESQVKEAELELLGAMNAADSEGMFEHLHSNCNSFWPGGQGLYNSEHSREGIEDTFASGFRFDLQYQDLDVEVYGNAAVVTGYLFGTASTPDGTTSRVNWRISIVRIRHGGKWKTVHWHEYPLMDES